MGTGPLRWCSGSGMRRGIVLRRGGSWRCWQGLRTVRVVSPNSKVGRAHRVPFARPDLSDQVVAGP